MRARPLAVFLYLLFVSSLLAQSPGPSISSISQFLGAGGQPITISGANFGAAQGSSAVTFGAAVASVSSWSDTSITAAVPSSLPAGDTTIVVTVNGVSSNAAAFTVIPVMTALSTYSASPGTQVTITGTGFDAGQGGSTITFNGLSASATSWSNTSIVTSVPAGASTGPLTVTVNSIATNSVNFTVPTPRPSLTSLSPGLGPIGTVVTLTGANFGDTQGGSRVLFPGLHGAPPSYPTSWSSTSITVPVPADAITGRVSVMVNGQVSNSIRFVVGTVTISSISPTSGIPGTSVSVTGSGFGSAQGTSTLTFNGVVATPTSWADSQIVAAVPAAASTGNVVVTVSGYASNGLSFTVLSATPVINSISPTSGPVGTSVTIIGSNFGATQGSSTVTFSGTHATVSSWSDAQIIATVPSGAVTGALVVTVAGQASNAPTFAVGAPPTINATVSPAPNSNGWIASNAAVTFTCTAGSAPLASCPGPQTVTTDGANQAVTGTATGTDGTSASKTVF